MDVARLKKERKASDGNDAGWKAAAATDVLSTDPDYLDGNYMVCVWEGKSFGLSPTLYKHPCANIPVCEKTSYPCGKHPCTKVK